ncbi:STAS domain-containing protein [Magnetospirillum sulfuroxidans]|uniref:STAS domain-containing protein n=1 Tax=Magnetospirillum sulfuroxidans TaxID=611300 RepID=A0ABS5I947_9PROT|nr:STAS domain-containing protein [Magnetospirillum sulfuroxidans]MBR9970935.1 STAS domain-containing protein [Magnetospirillum sulfuroxidans]
MQYKVQNDGSTALVTLEGQLDFSANDTFEKLLDGLKSAPPSKLIFDLSALSTIDSVGLGLLYIASEDLEGVPVVLRNPQGYVARLLELTDAAKMFQIER